MKYGSTKCPHCNEQFQVHPTALANVDIYGDNTFNLKCPKCNKMSRVSLIRKVVIAGIGKSDFPDEDFVW